MLHSDGLSYFWIFPFEAWPPEEGKFMVCNEHLRFSSFNNHVWAFTITNKRVNIIPISILSIAGNWSGKNAVTTFFHASSRAAFSWYSSTFWSQSALYFCTSLINSLVGIMSTCLTIDVLKLMAKVVHRQCTCSGNDNRHTRSTERTGVARRWRRLVAWRWPEQVLVAETGGREQ